MASLKIIFILSFLSYLHLIISENNIIRGNIVKKTRFEKVYNDVILNLIPLLSLSHIGLVKCCHKCLSCNKCLSFNINIESKECDLLAADRNNETSLDLFVSKQHWSYYDTVFKPVSNYSTNIRTYIFVLDISTSLRSLKLNFQDLFLLV